LCLVWHHRRRLSLNKVLRGTSYLSTVRCVTRCVYRGVHDLAQRKFFPSLRDVTFTQFDTKDGACMAISDQDGCTRPYPVHLFSEPSGDHFCLVRHWGSGVHGPVSDLDGYTPTRPVYARNLDVCIHANPSSVMHTSRFRAYTGRPSVHLDPHWTGWRACTGWVPE